MQRLIILIGVFAFLSCENGRKEDARSPGLCIQYFAQTFPSPNGNRCADDIGLFDSKTLDIALLEKPVWVTGIAKENRQIWAIALQDGTIDLIQTERGTLIAHKKKWKKINPGAPPVLGINCKGRPVLINVFAKNPAAFAAPVPVAEGKLAWVSGNGDLIVAGKSDTVSLHIEAMHDSRIIIDGKHRLLVLTQPAQYYHGVLADNTEARGVAIIETTPRVRILKKFTAPDSSVIEGVSAIWKDLNGDGRLEIAVTLSNNTEGTGGKHVIFDEDGHVLASGKSVKPDGWRHLLLAYQPSGSGPALLAAIQRPHVDRLLNLYAWEGDSLKTVAQLHGFSTHMAGSRNLDGVLCADINDDGYREILLPCTTHDTLYAVSYKNNKLKRIWNSPLQGISVTNIARAGHAAIALGTDKNVLKIWFAKETHY